VRSWKPKNNPHHQLRFLFAEDILKVQVHLALYRRQGCGSLAAGILAPRLSIHCLLPE
jgi:hypothetical protein